MSYPTSLDDYPEDALNAIDARLQPNSNGGDGLPLGHVGSGPDPADVSDGGGSGWDPDYSSY